MKKIYFLSTCSTCKKILKNWDISDSIKKIDLKKTPISALDLKELYSLSNSYEALFNKRAVLFREKKKHLEIITEKEYKEMLLAHYSFLKRPVLIINEKLFVGNSKETLNKAALEIKSGF